MMAPHPPSKGWGFKSHPYFVCGVWIFPHPLGTPVFSCSPVLRLIGLTKISHGLASCPRFPGLPRIGSRNADRCIQCREQIYHSPPTQTWPPVSYPFLFQNYIFPSLIFPSSPLFPVVCRLEDHYIPQHWTDLMIFLANDEDTWDGGYLEETTFQKQLEVVHVSRRSWGGGGFKH